MDLIELNIVGYSRSEFQHGAYALIFVEKKGERTFSIVIGSCETQSIAIGLESNIKISRPLTHDLFKTFANVFKINLLYVYIYKIQKGIFYSYLVFENKQNENIKIDARTSDAVAISIRFKVPIYTNEDVLNETSVIEKKQNTQTKKRKNVFKKESTNKPDLLELQKKLEDALEKENYEQAAEIRDLINKKNKKNN